MKSDATTDPSPPRLAVPVSDKDHAQGPPDAAVTLVEYGDYECPYCGNAYPVIKRLQQEMGPRLRFVFRNFPLNTVHAHAGVAAQAAEAAAAQGKFWEMHDLLYEHQKDLADADMVAELRIRLLRDSRGTPSIEALVHAFLPARFIDHTHADAILALTNQPGGERLAAEALGGDVIVLPYVTPGFKRPRSIRL